MARVTVEDCIEKVPNRFELVMMALQRSRELIAGASPNLPRDGDKNPVIALREIAENKVDRQVLMKELTESFHSSETAPASEAGSESEKPPEAAIGAERETKEIGNAGGQEEIGEKQWSEEEMIRALQDMEGEPSP